MIHWPSLSLANDQTYFVYDLDKIEQNILTIRRLFKNIGNIYFSVKANPSPLMLARLAAHGVNFDVSSEKELSLALEATKDINRITVSGPAKTDGFLEKIKNQNLKSVHLDSLEEYELLQTSLVPYTIRWPLEGEYSQKVGLPPQDLLKIARTSASGKKLIGVHVYIGRERASADIVKVKLEEIKNFVLQHRNAFVVSPELFWGGGLPLVNHLETGYFPDDPFFRIHLESGRSIVHNAGFYVTQILEVKEKLSEKIVIINGGLQHVAAHFGSPRYGQQDVKVYTQKVSKKSRVSFNIYGSLGTTTDLLAKSIELPADISRGDWLAIAPAGSYGYTAGVNQFLGPHSITEIFLSQGTITHNEIRQPSYLSAGVYAYKNS